MAPRVRTATGTLVESNKGNLLLECEGHRYRKRRAVPSSNKIYWRCVNEQECNGTAITAFETQQNESVAVKLGKLHMHDADFARNRIHAVVQTIKRRARSEPNERPLNIVRSVMANVNDHEVLARLPNRQALLRTINRMQNQGRPRNPRNLEELDIDRDYRQTISGQQFLQFDSGDQDR